MKTIRRHIASAITLAFILTPFLATDAHAAYSWRLIGSYTSFQNCQNAMYNRATKPPMPKELRCTQFPTTNPATGHWGLYEKF